MRLAMSAPEFYRSKANECRREAENAVGQLAKEKWLKMARLWDNLADQAEAGQFGQSSTGEPKPDNDK